MRMIGEILLYVHHSIVRDQYTDLKARRDDSLPIRRSKDLPTSNQTTSHRRTNAPSSNASIPIQTR